MIGFAGHFHCHDEYSTLDGTGNRNQLTYEAVRKGQTHLGITNHGRLGGVLEHVHACRHPEKYDNPLNPGERRTKEETLIPVLGMEAYYRPDRFMDCPSTWAYHLCLHAASLNGWRTLMRLSSKSWVDREQGGGFYGKPCVDLDMLKDDHDDLIISTACVSSPLSQAILAGDDRAARRFIRSAQRLVGDRLWFEIMPHDFDEQRTLNVEIVNLGNEYGIPCIATGDVHMPYKEWANTQSVVRMISYRTTVSKQDRKSEAGEDTYTEEVDTLYLSSGKQMTRMFERYHPDLPEDVVSEALANTAEFARQIRWFAISKTTKAPKVEVDAVAVVRQWCEEGWGRLLDRYPEEHWDSWSQKTYKDRLKMEFDVIHDKGVLDYFYIVGDFVRWAKSTDGLPMVNRKGHVRRNSDGEVICSGRKRPIRVGLGRGSAAGCLVSYLIGITAIDPIPHKLLFERFLNPDREGYPDIDMDFETGSTVLIHDGHELDGRECVKEYMRIVYGHDHVADIIAYQTFAPRAVIRAVGETQDIEYGILRKVTDSIDDTERGLEKIARQNEIVARFRDDFPDAWQHMLRLEDQIKNDSRHAGGVVITPRPTNDYMPTQTGKDGITTVTAWADRAEFPIMSDYGFLKYDILGVNSLNKQEVAVQLIKQHFGDIIEPNDLDALRSPYATEQRVIDAFVQGLTVGTFQFGGRGITQLLRHIRPNNAIDIAVANALYRPGPIKEAFKYGDRKNGRVKWGYWHDSLEPLLGETYGVIAFQEQVMEIVKVLGNFTGGESDSMRKAISKMYRLPGDEARIFMEQWREKWVGGCRDNHIREKDAIVIWESILEFAGYGFNRSHSASYGLQAYQDQWLKIHFPLAFYASLLTTEKKQKKEEQRDFLQAALREARVFEIDAAGPHINRSGLGWTIDDGKIRYGLVSISGIGGGAAQEIVEHRPFDDFRDYIVKMPSGFGVDNSVALAKAGAFDETDSRRLLLSRVRQWDDGVVKLKVKMTCGHLKSKTIKPRGKADIEDLVEEALDAMVCKHHPDAEVDSVRNVDDTYEVVRHIKGNPDVDIDPDEIVEEPTQEEIFDMEKDVLNIPLSQGSIMLAYKPFIERFIYTEEELEALPAKPQRRGRKHGLYCTCDDCDAASCTVGGEVTGVKVIRTKKAGDLMAFVDIAFGVNQYSCTLFPVVYRQFMDLLRVGNPVLVNGYADSSRGGVQIITTEVDTVIAVAEAKGWSPKRKAKAKFRNGRTVRPKIRAKVTA